MKHLAASLLIICLAGRLGQAQTIDFDAYANRYPDDEYVVLEDKISISFFTDPKDGNIKAKSAHSVSMLALRDDVDEMELIQIPFSAFEEVEMTSAKYFKLDSMNKKQLTENVKVKFAPSKNYYINNVFYSDLKVKEFSSSFTLRKKSVLTYNYEVTYNDLKFLTVFYPATGTVPVESFELTMKKPPVVEADVLLLNMESGDYIKKETTVGLEKQVTYSMKDIKYQEPPRYAPPSNYYLPHFIIVTRSVKKDGKMQPVLATPDDLYGWYKSLIKQLAPNKVMVKERADKAVQGATTPEEKIGKIFRWVQDNVNYVAFEDGIAGFKPEEAQEVLKSRFGDCKGMANLLVEMLKSQGFDAAHTWIGTRHVNYDYSIPSLVVDNHMICALRYEGEIYFLDATSKSASWKKIPYYLQGKQAMVAKGDTYELVNLPVDKAAANAIRFKGQVAVGAAGDYSFQGNVLITGSPYYRNKGSYLYQSKEDKAVFPWQLAQRCLNDQFPTQVSALKIDESAGQISLDLSMSSRAKAIKKGNNVLLFADLDETLSDLFPENDRKEPVYLEYPLNISCEVTIKLPAGAVVKKLPPNTTYTSADGSYVLKITYGQEAGKIIYNKEMSVNDNLILKKDAGWNDFLSELHHSYSTPVELQLN